MKRYVICPVRQVTGAELGVIRAFVLEKESEGDAVFWPYRDTEQDAKAVDICGQNYIALFNSNIVDVYWNNKSKGSIFDLGMAFGMNKEMNLINEVKVADYKSLEQLLVALANITR